MHFYRRYQINNILRLGPRQSYRTVSSTATGLIRSDVVLEFLNRSRVAIKDPLTCFPSDLIKPEEAETEYGITKRELRRWSSRKRNPTPHFRFNKYTIRYSKSLLQDWLMENSK
jgi:hypothetical protein